MTQTCKTVAGKYSSNDITIILFTDKKIFTVTSMKNPQNDRLYAPAATKKKDVSTEYLQAQLTFSH